MSTVTVSTSNTASVRSGDLGETSVHASVRWDNEPQRVSVGTRGRLLDDGHTREAVDVERLAQKFGEPWGRLYRRHPAALADRVGHDQRVVAVIRADVEAVPARTEGARKGDGDP